VSGHWWKRINSKVRAKVSHGLCFKFNTTFLTATIVSDWAKWFDYHNVIERISKKVYEVIKHTLSRGNKFLVIGLSANEEQLLQTII